jgi:hypothetical protein
MLSNLGMTSLALPESEAESMQVNSRPSAAEETRTRIPEIANLTVPHVIPGSITIFLNE